MWKLEIKFGNRNFEELIWEWEFFKKLNLRIGISKNYLKMEILKLNLRKGNFEELFENEICLKIRFKINWSFENLFECGILRN